MLEKITSKHDKAILLRYNDKKMILQEEFGMKKQILRMIKTTILLLGGGLAVWAGIL